MTEPKKSHNKSTNKITGWNVKDAVVREDSDPRGRVNLEPDQLDQLIRQKGCNVFIFRTSYCPNVKSIDGGEHEMNCTLCGGSGFIDRYPLQTKATILSQSLEKMVHVEGYVDGNSVTMTFPQGVELQYYNLIELLDHTDIFMQRIARSQGQIDRTQYKCLRVNLLIDKQGVEYFESRDFVLNINGDIVWKEDKGPVPGTIFSIHYEALVQFRATRAMHVNRFTQIRTEDGQIAFIKLPEQWLCQKEFMIRRKDAAGVELPPNKIPDYLEETPED